jgi:hypothetical protein
MSSYLTENNANYYLEIITELREGLATDNETNIEMYKLTCELEDCLTDFMEAIETDD